MSSHVQTYIQSIARKFEKGNATEHTYRGDMVTLSAAILGKNFELTNEPKRQQCGAPDFILEKNDIPIGFIEAKDIGRLDGFTKLEKDQFERYKASLDNLIYTDYLEFRFYKHGELIISVAIGKIAGKKVIPLPDNFEIFTNLMRDFATYQTQTINSSKILASMMAKKAVLIKDVFTKILSIPKPRGATDTLHDQYDEFKRILLHNVTYAEFADIYAETIAYGLFTARLHDTTLDTFTRGEAYELIPRSNPFLRQLFTYVGTNLDDRAVWIVDALCDVFRATDVSSMLQSFNRGTGRSDPFLHFYEDFLREYNPGKRDARGVWYTPEAVVRFIVKAVDDVLKNHFNLPMGLADTSQTVIQVPQFSASGLSKIKVDRQVHRVQVLDVATGTGTFLAEVIAQIYAKYSDQKGMWSTYVERDLIPRIHGFELLMASYAMCHMKLELLLHETGYAPREKNAPRLKVYLTNSLEKPDGGQNYLPLLDWFSRESNEASDIKRTTPIMVAIGNPPYSGESSNKDPWIMDLMKDYKKEPSGGPLKERNPKWINDDYVKFIRLGSHYIEKNKEGILAYITNHSYLDNPTFRGMRWHMLKTFDEIYVIDLHGSSKKNEIAPDGSADKNVFDIQQGVAILIGIKRKADAKRKPLAKIYHSEVWGSRESKYAFLNDGRIKDLNWNTINYQDPFYFFIPKNMEGFDSYQDGFKLNEVFTLHGTGIVTKRDNLTIQKTEEAVWECVNSFIKEDESKVRLIYELPEDVRDWKFEWAKRDLIESGLSKDKIKSIFYRPFDTRFIYYTGNARGFVGWPVQKIMRHFLLQDNIGMMISKQQKASGFTHVLAHKGIVESSYVSNKTSEIGYSFPLYLYEGGLIKTKTPNLNGMIWEKMKRKVGKIAEDPQAVFDYIYAVLHAPTYRQRYAEFLKSDFPHIPYPSNSKKFEAMVKYGAILRQLHLLEHSDCRPLKGMAAYPIDGSHEVSKIAYNGGKVWINDSQYFEGVPQVAWDFHIGGYQPAQKWLKDRRGTRLDFGDIEHYRMIISSLTKTSEVMDLIDTVYVAA